MKETIVPSTDLRKVLPKYIEATEDSEVIVITVHGRPKAVLVGFNDYRQMQAAIEMAQGSDVAGRTQQNIEALMRGEGAPLDESLGLAAEPDAQVRPLITIKRGQRQGFVEISETELDKLRRVQELLGSVHLNQFNG